MARIKSPLPARSGIQCAMPSAENKITIVEMIPIKAIIHHEKENACSVVCGSLAE